MHRKLLPQKFFLNNPQITPKPFQNNALSSFEIVESVRLSENISAG